jgi:hypothetical protein
MGYIPLVQRVKFQACSGRSVTHSDRASFLMNITYCGRAGEWKDQCALHLNYANTYSLYEHW